MSEHSDDFGPDAFLVSTFIEFAGREFEVVIGHDGNSYWFDPSAKNAELDANPHFMIEVLVGNRASRKRYANIQEEYMLKAPVPEPGLTIIKEELSPAYWDENMPEDFDDRLDAILIPIFWEHVNPYLSPPIER